MPEGKTPKVTILELPTVRLKDSAEGKCFDWLKLVRVFEVLQVKPSSLSSRSDFLRAAIAGEELSL